MGTTNTTPLIIEVRANDFWPVCEQSRFFAELAGTKTLTLRTIGLLTAWGYRFAGPDGHPVLAPAMTPTASPPKLVSLSVTKPVSAMPAAPATQRGVLARMIGR